MDIDATGVVSSKKGALRGYTGEKGYFPMVGHAAETGRVVACDFREGNASPNSENLEFIQQCERSLPEDCSIGALRIDAEGYQRKIIQYCDETMIRYAIRARMSDDIRDCIGSAREDQWEPLLDRKRLAIENQDTLRTLHCIGDYEKAFTLIIQRTCKKGQAELDLNDAPLN